MPSRPATLKDPDTSGQVVLDEHSLTHFPSQLWCKVCVESLARDSPHWEPSKLDAVVPQLQFDNGYMGDGGLPQVVCSFVETDTSIWSHTRGTGARLQQDGHALRVCWNSQVSAWPGIRMLLPTPKQRSSSVATGQRCQRMSS